MATEVRRRFEPTPEAVREARRFFRNAVADQLDGPMNDDLALALSELATNAARHARTPFEVVVHTDGHVKIEVEDRSDRRPERRSAAADAEGGRGLLILDAVCDRWGVHVVEDRKCVWCERSLTEVGRPQRELG